jgi:hypothetical protein
MNDLASNAVKIEVRCSESTRRIIEGEFERFTSRWLFLDAKERVSPSSVVSVEHGDVLLVGEVVACQTSEDGSWRLKIQVKHKLTRIQSLTTFRDALLGLNMRSPSVEVVHQ